MKLFIRSSILKNTLVEMDSPFLVESTYSEKTYLKKTIMHGVPVEYPVFSQTLAGEAEISEPHEQEITSRLMQESEALKVLVQAEKEAEIILSEARKKAEELLESVRTESDLLRKTLEENVREEIGAIAQAEGYEKGLKEAADEATRMRKQAKDYLELAQRALRAEFQRVDQELIHLCLKISERIIHSALKIEPSKLLDIIRSLSLMPREKKGAKIHISQQDWEWIKRLPAEDKPSCLMIADDTLGAGDAFLECEEGFFDARLEAQLEKVSQYLLEELDNGLDGTREEN